MMKRTGTILIIMMAATLALAQSPAVIHTTRNQMNAVSAKKTAATNEALNAARPPAAKPAAHPGSNQPAAKNSVAHPAAGEKHAERRHHHGIVGYVVGVPGAEGQPAGQPGASAAEQEQAAEMRNAAGEQAADQAGEQSVNPDPRTAANGRRDPFISPVVQRSGGSGCSTGKKCLEIGEISLKGVVHSQDGFIAVVSNGLQKAYFLRENDPVFNGYVVKITGDSIVFQETLQDRLGKTFTREVTKKITTPAV
jgi:hypothetical protein